MPLIPYVPFADGTPLTPEIANAITKPVFDGQEQYFGHLAKITDNDLSDDPGALKAQVAAANLNLKVTAGNGLNALVASGKAIYGSTIYNLANTSLTLQPSATNSVYVGQDGVVRTSTVEPPTIRALLAIVTTNTSGVLTVEDRREGTRNETIKPFTLSLRNFGGRGDSGAFLAAGGEVLADGEYYFTDFTVPIGRTITVDKLARIYCTGNAVVAGTVNVTPAAAGGGQILSSSKGDSTGSPGYGLGGGNNEPVLGTYNHLMSPIGSGGGGGNFIRDFDDTSGILSAPGGAGGGCFWIEAAGSITLTGTINANGADGGNGVAQGVAGSIYCCGGGGGGSGGLVLLKALGAIIASGIINVQGGKGGNGIPSNGLRAAETGSGGGGGRIVMFSPAINTTGSTLNRAGGLGGLNGAGNLVATWVGYGAVGGSYGGKGGDNSAPGGNGSPGEIGVLVTRAFTPVG